MRSPFNHRSGSALVIILPLVAVLTLIVLSVLFISRFDTHLASTTFEETRASSLVRNAIDDVSDKLSTIPLDRHWASGPGLLQIWNGTSWDKVDLHSGAPGAAPSTADYQDGATSTTAAKVVNLNVKLADGSYAILPANAEYPTAPDMTVKWIYVMQDGTTRTDATTLPTSGVIGRYAYWTDVENGRVNINTAGFGMVNTPSGRFQSNLETLFNQPGGIDYIRGNYASTVWNPNPWMTDHVTADPTTGVLNFPAFPSRLNVQQATIQNLVAHPSSIDLSFLDFSSNPGEALDDSFKTFRYAGSYFLRVDARNSYSFEGVDQMTANPDVSVRFFHNPKDWELIVDDATYQKNKGYITVMGRTPEINPWGLPKLAMNLASKDGHALNDLTEYYDRMMGTVHSAAVVADAVDTRDSRRVQVPAVEPAGTQSSQQGTLPRPLTSSRTSFRDITSTQYWISYVIPTGTLFHDLKAMLSQPFPGYSSLSTKYGDKETEQIALEIETFAENCLNYGYPGYAANVAGNGIDWTGMNMPVVCGPEPPGGFERRIGTSGEMLCNEFIMTLQPESSSAVQGILNIPPPPLTYPVTYANNSYFGGPSYITLLRAPTTGTTYDPSDKFLVFNLDGEVMTPQHYGFAQPSSLSLEGDNPSALTCNNVITWSYQNGAGPMTIGSSGFSVYNGLTWFPDQPGDPTATPPRLDNPAHYGNGFFYNFLAGVTTFNVYSYPFSTTRDSYATMSRAANPLFVVGPFAAGTNLAQIALKFRLVFYWSFGNPHLWVQFPGIFPDTAGIDPNAAQAGTYLNYTFQHINVDDVTPTQISLEASDPRMTRNSTDWSPSEPDIIAGTLGYSNTALAIGADTSDVARPPSYLQLTRGFLRGAGQQEMQTASRILGLPGVGYLSSIFTGADSGAMFRTLKFYNDPLDIPSPTNPPDWLIWNLFYVPFDRSMSNQTDGKLNINAKLYPFKDGAGNYLVRQKPLEALLGNRVTDQATLAGNIAKGVGNAGPSSSDLYVYSGQICRVPGLADTGANEYEKERLPRDLADIVTTQSSDFRVFAVVQSLKQSPTGQIIPTTTQRVETTLSRVTDSGAQGYAFSGEDDGGYTSRILLRSDYRPASGVANPAATRTTIDTTRTASNLSPLGTSHLINSPENWLVPQKIEISHYALIK